MILVTGGAHQGKRDFARSLAAELSETEFFDCAANGSVCRPEELLRKPVIFAYQETVRRLVLSGEDPDRFTRRLIAAGPGIVTLDEVGCGIVPTERFERDFREAVGRSGQLLAAHAEAVFRVICGIPQKIK